MSINQAYPSNTDERDNKQMQKNKQKKEHQNINNKEWTSQIEKHDLHAQITSESYGNNVESGLSNTHHRLPEIWLKLVPKKQKSKLSFEQLRSCRELHVL